MIRVVAVVALTVVLTGACSVPIETPQEGETSVSAGEKDVKAGEKDLKPTKKAGTISVAKANALVSAKSYVELTGFSLAGLIQQLSSKAGDGYKHADAVWAVNHLKVDWNAEAVESAKSYLDMTGFSRSGLIEQLSSKAGDQYTVKQATYAADKVGL
jgi:hypothetical protein